LAATDNLSHLRKLTVMNGNGDPTAAALARCPSLDGLTDLYLSGARTLTAAGLATFTTSANVTNLTTLYLDAIPFGVDCALVLAGPPKLAALTHLTTTPHSRDQGLAALAGAPHLAGRRWLCLRRNRIGLPGIEALAAGRHLKRLQILELGDNPFGP